MSSQAAKAAGAFARGAPRYWCRVYPQVCAEMTRQRRAATAIADPQQRRAALIALTTKRGNVDGAAAFAAFVAPSRRTAVIRAQVAFQALYDYLDVLTELPNPDPVGNSRALHAALMAALQPPRADSTDPILGYAGSPRCTDAPRTPREDSTDPILGYAGRADADYVGDTVARCRASLAQLPSYAVVAPAARRLAEYIVQFQSFNVTNASAPRASLARWAGERTPPRSGLRWWETAAAAGSSLGIFALLALASRPWVSANQALAVEGAYFPWIGALHSLLDSLIDVAEDESSGQPNLVVEYGSPAEAAERLRLLASESRSHAERLPDAGAHLAVLASMASLYLAERQARAPFARAAGRQVLEAVGPLALPSMLVLRARRALVAHAGTAAASPQ